MSPYTFSDSLVIAVTLTAKYKRDTAAMLFFHVLQDCGGSRVRFSARAGKFLPPRPEWL